MATKKTSKTSGKSSSKSSSKSGSKSVSKSGSKSGSKGSTKKSGSKSGSKGASKSGSKGASKSGSKKSVAGKHVGAAQTAAALASKMVASNPNIEAFKRVIVRNRAVQDRLAAAGSEKEFISTAVGLAAEHGLPFSESQARSHLKTVQEMHPAFAAVSAEIDPNPGGGGGGGGSSPGCGSQGTSSSSAYSLQCGLSTQKCLCTI